MYSLLIGTKCIYHGFGVWLPLIHRAFASMYLQYEVPPPMRLRIMKNEHPDWIFRLFSQTILEVLIVAPRWFRFLLKFISSNL
jgi:hypothetical protein